MQSIDSNQQKSPTGLIDCLYPWTSDERDAAPFVDSPMSVSIWSYGNSTNSVQILTRSDEIYIYATLLHKAFRHNEFQSQKQVYQSSDMDRRAETYAGRIVVPQMNHKDDVTSVGQQFSDQETRQTDGHTDGRTDTRHMLHAFRYGQHNNYKYRHDQIK